MNLFEGTINASGATFEGPGGISIPLDETAVQNAAGRSVTLGVRPQHLEPAADGIDLTVRICEPLGDETDVMLDGPGGSNFTARLKLDAVPAPGSSMTLGPKPGGLHLFDTATGERLA